MIQLSIQEPLLFGCGRYLSQSLSNFIALRYSPNTISPECEVSLSSVEAISNFNIVCVILLLLGKSFTKWVKVFSVAFVFLLSYYTVFTLILLFFYFGIRGIILDPILLLF